MSKYSVLIKRASNAIAATTLTIASLTPAIMLSGSSKAAQMTERKITLSNSLAADDNSTYTVSFKNATAGTVKGIVVQFCSDSPIIGDTCTAPTGLDVTGSSVTSLDSVTSWSTSATTNLVKITDTTGSSAAAAEEYTFALNVDNPDAVGTFWARVLTYSSDTTATNYTSAAPGAYVDAGGIAITTTSDVTINARVKETLTFCVGADATPASVIVCGDIDGQVVDLGTLNTSAVNTTPVATALDGNNKEGVFIVSTNAFFGVKVSYSSGTSLRVGSTTCENGDTAATDQCINSAIAGLAIASGEGFGMKIPAITDQDIIGGESDLLATAPYNGSDFSWNTGSSAEIASTSSVVSSDVATMRFRASPAATTPSGFYTTSANFVATATF